MNCVTLAGTVTDRPFRPGNGSRVVVKVRANNLAGRAEQLEFDAFGKLADVAMTLWVGDVVTVVGRLENRQYLQDGEDVTETRCVADNLEILARARDLTRPAH